MFQGSWKVLFAMLCRSLDLLSLSPLDSMGLSALGLRWERYLAEVAELTETKWDASVMCLTDILCKPYGFLCDSCHCCLGVFSLFLLSWTSAEQSRRHSWRLPPCTPLVAMVLSPAWCQGAVVWQKDRLETWNHCGKHHSLPWCRNLPTDDCLWLKIKHMICW